MKSVNADNRLIYLVVAAILLMPVHLGYFPSAHADTLSPESMAHDGVTGHCEHAGEELSSQICISHLNMGDATLTDDCCDDNCFGSQIFLPIAYTTLPVTDTRFQRTHNVRPPEPLITAEYRPPIHHS